MLIGFEPLPELLAVVSGVPQGLVQVHIVVGYVDDAPGDIGTVVRRALQVGQQVQPCEARADGALPPLEAEDVAGFDTYIERYRSGLKAEKAAVESVGRTSKDVPS